MLRRHLTSLFLLATFVGALSACASFRPGETPDVTYEGPIATGSRLYKHQKRRANASPSNIRVINTRELAVSGSAGIAAAVSKPGVGR